jgi:lipoprotein-anchoring transpeptidase ErfK/SrfK
MPRAHRISRGLIGLLGVVIVLGLILYFNNVRKTSASEAPPPAPPRADRSMNRTAAVEPGAAMPTMTTPKVDVRSPSTNPATPPTRMIQHGGVPGSSGNTAAGSNLTTLNEALQKKSSGDLLGARKLLSEALISGHLNPSDADAARRMLSEMNQTLVFSPKVAAGDAFASTYTVKSGELMRSIAEKFDVPWELIARLNNMPDPRKLRAGQNLKVVTGPFHAIVSKSRFTLDVYLGSPGEKGSLFVRSFDVGLGANDSTPTGSWIVETHKKIKNPTYFSPRGEGVIAADDPKNPLGERWIGLTGIDGHAVGKQSYGIHGTIEPDSIGKQASMGCIRMRNEDVELLFDMMTEGKSVVVVRE